MRRLGRRHKAHDLGVGGQRCAHGFRLPAVSEHDRMSDAVRNRAGSFDRDREIEQQARLGGGQVLEDYAPPAVRQDFFGVGSEGGGRDQLERMGRQHLRHVLERGAEEEDVGQAFRVIGAHPFVELGAVERKVGNDDALAGRGERFRDLYAGVGGPATALGEWPYREQQYRGRSPASNQVIQYGRRDPARHIERNRVRPPLGSMHSQ